MNSRHLNQLPVDASPFLDVVFYADFTQPFKIGKAIVVLSTVAYTIKLKYLANKIKGGKQGITLSVSAHSVFRCTKSPSGDLFRKSKVVCTS